MPAVLSEMVAVTASEVFLFRLKSSPRKHPGGRCPAPSLPSPTPTDAQPGGRQVEPSRGVEQVRRVVPPQAVLLCIDVHAQLRLHLLGEGGGGQGDKERLCQQQQALPRAGSSACTLGWRRQGTQARATATDARHRQREERLHVWMWRPAQLCARPSRPGSSHVRVHVALAA